MAGGRGGSLRNRLTALGVPGPVTVGRSGPPDGLELGACQRTWRLRGRRANGKRWKEETVLDTYGIQVLDNAPARRHAAAGLPADFFDRLLAEVSTLLCDTADRWFASE